MVTSKSAEVGDRILKVTFCFILMEEIWKDVVGYEGYYQVSNLGRVKGVERKVKNRNGLSVKKEHIIRLHNNKAGYPAVVLSNNNKHRTHLVHRLVATAFIPNPYNFPCVNHKDETRTNNFVFINEDGTVDYDKSNLEWCTYKYNSNYGTSKARISETRKNNKNNEDIIRRQKETKRKNGSYSAERPVNQFTWDGKFIKRFCSVTEAGKVTGAKNVHFCCINRFSHSGGFIWLYDEDVNSIGERVLDENPTREILQYDKNGAFLKKWKSPIYINRELKISLTALSNCLHGRAKTSGGFIWKYNK